MRKPLTLAAKCRTLTGMSDDAYLSDLSPHGCCITTRGLLFRLGARVVIKPNGLEAIGGIIRWIAGNRAGVEFEQPLYAPVVEHLSSAHPHGTPVGIRHRSY
ncbi:MAG: PilZ domain-containing protein [Proteobacteria bacterium]|nr:PilZ domain-containing protein [Pseudomonadota bacterium]